ncbi:MAG: glycosyltransferase family 2 protein [Flammeovirgaceae bacterium]|nr:glycosyltransferase family 2 protein [Flammeovirgaceae bacterium]
MRTFLHHWFGIPTKPGKGPFLKAPIKIAVDQRPKLSFCITHKDRFEYLQKTLLQNLKDNEEDRLNIEFILMDFHESDEVMHWIREIFPKEIGQGYLKYFRAKIQGWSAPLAKNTAHYVASGSILTNLDCDNFTGREGGRFVLEQYYKEESNLMLWQFSRVRRDGSYGRMSFYQQAFEDLGGYDEGLMEMGFQDNDLMLRALKMGVKRIERNDKLYNKAIKHEKYKPAHMSFRSMEHWNKARSKTNIKQQKLNANNGSFGLREEILFLNKEGEMEPFEKS